ncbi:MAG: hypothetical protein JWP04_1524 [Belnapia sp.]|nr:hypothetical protein [Belnapia sp.]
MGAFNEFKPLLQGGVKILKYKQEKMIEATKGLVAAEEYQLGAKGICDALTLRWLAQRLGTKNGKKGFGAGDMKIAREINDIGLARQAFAMHAFIADNHAILGGRESLKAGAKKYGLILDTGEIERMEVTKSFASMLDDCDLETKILGNAHYFSYFVDIDGKYIGRHAVGMVGIGGECYFFDSNIGEFKIDDMAKFSKTYVDTYRSSSFKWQIHTGVKCLVTM